MLFQNNPMSLFCSIVCDHASQCEGHCILNRKEAAILLRQKGYRVTIFEAKNKIGGVLRYDIPDFCLPAPATFLYVFPVKTHIFTGFSLQ